MTMFRTTANFDKLLEKATSNLRLEPDWPSILQICDLIRQGDVQPKYALLAIKKKLYNANPHIALFGLLVLESCVKNCGNLIHDEIGTKVYMEQLRDLVKTTAHDNVKNKVLELIQAWAFAFRNSPKYRAVQDTVNIMKAESYKFPALKESDAMFSADTAPEWADGECCHRCRVQFGMVQRKHHCRACGQVFCAQCSAKTSTIPKFGIEKEVRVCEACFDSLNKPISSVKAEGPGELPAEYLASSLAQQNQAPARKTEEELREEEELQLALALSQSEAEEKEKVKKRNTSAIMSGGATARSKSYSPPTVKATDRSGSPGAAPEEIEDPELARYLNRAYWEKRQKEEQMAGGLNDRGVSPLSQQPSAPTNLPSPMVAFAKSHKQENGGISDAQIDDFVSTLRTQVEIFVNRMKSNSSRGRSIANDSSVQTLFMNITAMHSQLLRYIQQQDDSRVYYEGLQDKLAQVKDARAALDALRDEHRDKLRRQAEENERQRQMQMAHKLEIMRTKKQEYLQYQRQLALRRIQEQEREMQMRQEQQKQQYLMQYGGGGSGGMGGYAPPPGSPGGYHPSQQQGYQDYPRYPMSMQGPMMGGQMMGGQGQMQGPPGQMQAPPGQMQGPPGQMQGPQGQMQGPPGQMQGPPGQMQGPPGQMHGPPGQMQSLPGQMQGLPMQRPPGQMQGPPGQMQGLPMQRPSGQMQGLPGPMPMQGPPGQMQGPPGQMQGPPGQMQGPPGQMQGLPGPMQGLPGPGPMQMPPHMQGPASSDMMGHPHGGFPPGHQATPPVTPKSEDPQPTGELISFD